MAPMSCVSSSLNACILQLTGRRGKLVLGSLHELLIATVEKPRHFTLHQHSGPDGVCCRSVFRILGAARRHQNRSHSAFAHQRTPGSARKRSHFEGVCAQQFQRLVEVGMRGFFLHKFSLFGKNRGRSRRILVTPISHTCVPRCNSSCFDTGSNPDAAPARRERSRLCRLPSERQTNGVRDRRIGSARPYPMENQKLLYTTRW